MHQRAAFGSVLICGARRSRRFNMALQIHDEAGPNLGLAMKPALPRQIRTLPGIFVIRRQPRCMRELLRRSAQFFVESGAQALTQGHTRPLGAKAISRRDYLKFLAVAVGQDCSFYHMKTTPRGADDGAVTLGERGDYAGPVHVQSNLKRSWESSLASSRKN
jgi:hypothetical protein